MAPRIPSRIAGARTALAVGAALLSVLLAGCGATSHPQPAARTVAVSERDFHIDAPARISPGRVVLRVHNEGPDQHELILVRTGGLTPPLRSDGITVDEEAVEAAEPGSLEPGAPGSTRELSVDLKPGRYLFFCNMEGHFMGGMHAEVVVG
jgi:hypothetical protein